MDRISDLYALLELEGYLWGVNGWGLSDYELPYPDQSLSQFDFSTTGTTEAKKLAATWQELQRALQNPNAEQRSVFNKKVGTVHPGMICENIEQPLYEFSSSLSAQNQLYQVHNVGYVSQPR